MSAGLYELPAGGIDFQSPHATDEIYHVLEGEGLFNDGRKEVRLGPGDTVIFPAGQAHRVEALTRMVLYRVQAGADRHPEFLDAWPAP